MSNTTTTIIKEIKDVLEHHGTVFSFEEEKNCVIGDIAQIFADKLQEVERTKVEEIEGLFKKSFVTTDVYLVDRFLKKLAQLNKKGEGK